MNDKMEDNIFYFFFYKVFENMFEYMKLGGVIYVCYVDIEGFNFRNVFKNVGYKFVECFIWVKNVFVLGR